LELWGTISPGSGSYRVSIDDGEKTSGFGVDRQAWADHTLLWRSEELSDNEHTVVFTVDLGGADPNQAIIIPDYFIYTTSSKTPMGDVLLLVDSDDEKIQYEGNWSQPLEATNHYIKSGTARRSQSLNDTFILEFEGMLLLQFRVYTVADFCRHWH